MKQGCPNHSCDYFQKNDLVKKDGRYFRHDDRHFVQRFQCRHCLKKFSYSTQTLEYRQKKRTKNLLIMKNLASGISQRRCALILNLNRTTIAKKFHYLAKKARLNHEKSLAQMANHSLLELQFDDLITSIHTKLKPASISVVIDPKNRYILGAKVSGIPAFGKIADISKRKYGFRKNEHRKNLDELLKKIAPKCDLDVFIETDQHKFYPDVIKKYFPHSTHVAYKGMRASVVGMGELKTKKYDPLFKINHTLAMFRANINRLVRRTWCTSKKLDALQDHVDLYVHFHNEFLIKN